MSRIARALLLGTAFLSASLPLAAGSAELVSDLETAPVTQGLFHGVQEPLTPLGDRLLFQAYEASSGSELWASDGTPKGTRLLVDVAPGGESSTFLTLGTVRRTAVLLRDVGFGVGPWDLWRSDGTVEGTYALDDRVALDSCSFRRGDPEAVVVGNRLFFLAANGSGCALWTTDGTVGGTRIVQDDLGQAESLVAAGNRVFFFSMGSLWTSDGAGASMVKSFESTGSGEPRGLLAAGSRVAFVAGTAGGGEEIWTSDGTAAGTLARTRFFEADPFGEDGLPLLKAFGDTVYFLADDGTGVDLWRVGAAAGAAQRVTDFVDSSPFAFGFGADQLALLGNRLVFPGGSESFPSLWVSGGTPETTKAISGCPGGCPSRVAPASLLQIGDRVVFKAFGTRDREEIWVTDGTDAGTKRLADIAVSFSPALLLGKVFFMGPGSGNRYALWKTDGTPAGTVPIGELEAGAFNGGFSLGFSPVAAGNRIFFVANLDRQPQLWVSTGGPAGTRAITNVRDVPSSYPRSFAALGDGALFSANLDGRRALWKTDGTAAGTHPLSAVGPPLTILPAPGGLSFVLSGYDRFTPPFQVWRSDGTEAGTFRVDPADQATLGVLARYPEAGNGAAFGLDEGDHLSLWTTDGSLAGTRRRVDLPADIVSIQSLRAFGSRLYFVVRREPGSYELWTSDGTTAGTHSLTEGKENLTLRLQPSMAQVGGTVYFAAEDGLWRTDGTPAGTVRVPLFHEEEGFRPVDLTVFQGALYFIGGPSSARALWRVDGTPEGTFLVAFVGVPAEEYVYEDPVRMVALGDRLVFLADDGTHGVEPWSSDGSPTGTRLLRDVAPGPASSSPSLPVSLAIAGGKVFFPATDGKGGFELWETDATAAGTRRVQDIAPGPLSSSPSELTGVGSRLFFSAYDAVHGEEPWVLSTQETGCVPSATALCLGGRFRVEADWQDFQGNKGRGRSVPLTADTGAFWFFDGANLEVVLKVLDGRAVNDHFWVSYGALTNVQYVLTVTDTQTGSLRQYFNPPGWLGSLADTEAFGPRGATLAGVVTRGPASQPAAVTTASTASTASTAERSTAAMAAAEPCVPGPERLCLSGGRFAVEARWKLPDGSAGSGRVVPLAGGDTGYLWFFSESNVEVVLKVLDGRAVNGRFWVFFGALSDVEYTLTVTDTETGAVKTYTNPRGRLASVADTNAF